MPVGATAHRLPAVHDGAKSSLLNARQQTARRDRRDASGLHTGGGGSRGRTDRRHHCLPVREGHWGGLAAWIRAGKKITGRKLHIVPDTLRSMLKGLVHAVDVQIRRSPRSGRAILRCVFRDHQAVRRRQLCRAEDPGQWTHTLIG